MRRPTRRRHKRFAASNFAGCCPTTVPLMGPHIEERALRRRRERYGRRHRFVRIAGQQRETGLAGHAVRVDRHRRNWILPGWVGVIVACHSPFERYRRRRSCTASARRCSTAPPPPGCTTTGWPGTLGKLGVTLMPHIRRRQRQCRAHHDRVGRGQRAVADDRRSGRKFRPAQDRLPGDDAGVRVRAWRPSGRFCAE